VDALNKFNIREESAPQGFLLRTGLSELADAEENFAIAFDEALTTAGIDSVVSWALFPQGYVLVSDTGSMLDSTRLDIDPVIVTEMLSKLTEVQDAATSLGLDDCAPEKMESNE
jgi:hypothetical protein